MADFINNIASEAANASASSSDSSHYNLPIYEWFGAEHSFPTKIEPDLGDSTGAYFGDNNTDFTRYGTLFLTPGLSSSEKGFEIRKESTTNAHSAIIEFRTGIGHWMPAPLFRTLSYFWKNHTQYNANWRVYTPGLTLRNYKTNQQKRWTAGWTQGNDPTNSGKLFKVTGLNKAQQVNALGPDWYVVGAWFYMYSQGTSGNQNPRGELTDFRLGWHNPDTGAGATKLIIPDKMTWNDFRTMKQRGEVSFYEKPQVTDKKIVGEWDWNGKSSNYLLYYMCLDADYVGTAFYYTTSDHTRVSKYDKYGRNLLDLVRNTDLWFKLDGYPAVFRPAETFSISATSCSMPLVSTTGPDLSSGKEDQGGVLRAYLENPDA